MNSSRAAKKAKTVSGPDQPGIAARLTSTGPPAPIVGPTYGMNRSAPPRAAHTKAYGTSSRYIPTKAMQAQMTLTSDCISRNLLTRLPASSKPRVVVASRPRPIRPTRRSRMSRRSSSMKMTSATTSAAVPSGSSHGPSQVNPDAADAGSDVTTTG